jgi:hypothetical protein
MESPRYEMDVNVHRRSGNIQLDRYPFSEVESAAASKIVETSPQGDVAPRTLSPAASIDITTGHDLLPHRTNSNVPAVDNELPS